MAWFRLDDVWMAEVDLSVGVAAGPRRRRSAAERRRVVEETLEAGAPVAKVALKYGVNANQVFQWRRLYRDGKLGAASSAMKLLPVSVVEETRALHWYFLPRPICSPLTLATWLGPLRRFVLAHP
ncbi:transposase [Granulicella aggregans]|uniref:transposase n=1 Tax=Granulicella aggregans TaxID=474949 RepID=UPI003D7C16CB